MLVYPRVLFCLASGYSALMFGFSAPEQNFAERYIIKCNMWPRLPSPTAYDFSDSVRGVFTKGWMPDWLYVQMLSFCFSKHKPSFEVTY